MRWFWPGPPGTLWLHSTSSVACPLGGIGLTSEMVARVDLRPKATFSVGGAGAAPRPRPPRPTAGGLRFTGWPFTDMRVMAKPSVSSAGTHGAARGTLNRNMFMSSRITMLASESAVLLWSTIVSRPVIRDVAGSRRALIV